VIETMVFVGLYNFSTEVKQKLGVRYFC